MDPLVRAALVTQNLLGRCLYMGLNVGLAVTLILIQSGQASPLLLWLVLAALGLTLATRLRSRRLIASDSVRRDLELFTQLVLLVQTGLLLAGPSLGQGWSASIYIVFMLAAAFARPEAAFGR